jgi:hypothetical protein
MMKSQSVILLVTTLWWFGCDPPMDSILSKRGDGLYIMATRKRERINTLSREAFFYSSDNSCDFVKTIQGATGDPV